MGVCGCIKWLCIKIVQILCVMLIIIYLPYVPPTSKMTTPYKVHQVQTLDGKLALNTKLNDVEIWHLNDLTGPECFADYKGELYVSLNGGDIAKLTGNHITPVTKFGKPCRGDYESKLCGRPLGITFDETGTLYAADAYYGIYKVDVHTGQHQQIISMQQEIEGRQPMLFNSLVVASNKDIYFTDSSTEFALHDGLFDMLADGSGRLIHYNAATKQLKVLMNNIHFANGVAFGPNEDFLVVSETARNRLHRYYLKGARKNTHDVFVEALPGLPDNLKSDGQGGFIVPLVVASDDQNPVGFQIFGQFPSVRKLIARMFGIAELMFQKLNELYPNEFCQKAVFMIGHFGSTNFLLTSRVTILHISSAGQILDSLHGDNRQISTISEAHIFNGNLYLGSPFNHYIGRIPLAKIGWTHLEQKQKSQQKPKPTVAPKVVTQKPVESPKKVEKPVEETTKKPVVEKKETVAPKKETPPPKKEVPPVKKEAPAVKKEAPAVKKEAPPVKKEAPKKEAPAVKKEAPAVKKEAPPPAKKEAPPPPKKEAPPPPKKDASPPTKKQTPPPAKKESPPPPPAEAKKDTPPPVKAKDGNHGNAQAVPVKDGTKPIGK